MTKKSTRASCSIVAYLRTSTDDQRLGIEAQRETVERMARERGCTIAREYVEHESGGKNDRPELARAINHARRIGAILAVAKLDRLSRDPIFLLTLIQGNVPIIFGDLSDLDATTAAGMAQLHVMVMIAGFERKRISERTRDALQALKAKGVKLGTPANLTAEARAKGVKAASSSRTARAIAEMTDVAPIIAKLRADGATLQAIADHLNAEGYATRKGGKWATTQVKRVLDRSSH